MTPASEPTKRRELPARREAITQKAYIGTQRTVYVSVHNDPHPAELFLRVKGKDCTSEIINLFDVLARISSKALQYGMPVEEVGELLYQTKCEPAGVVQHHARIRNCTSLTDYIGRHLLIEYCGRDELAHVTEATG